MSLPVFWVDGERLRAGDVVELDGDEGHHAAVVRRIRIGELIELTDGAGHLARCVVSDAGKGGLRCEVRSRLDVPPPVPRVTVVQALPKGDRGELAVELMTEVGVDTIVPWAASRCITQWKGERGAKALRRWRSTAREAAKQSRRAWFPDVTELATTAGVVELIRPAAMPLILHEGAGGGVGELAPPPAGDLVLVVGPEGGITDDEIDTFSAVGAVAVRFGPTVLRTSTAGAVAAGVLLSRTARWS
ncbi:MAG TPA: 16S rRNA (uracil(1498)-N(3))-methyltransferase [Jiangellaceae bacterium]